MTLTDIDPVLAARVDAALPPMTLELATVLAAGRSRVRRRRAAGAVGAVGALVVVAALTTTILDQSPVRPAGAVQQHARPLGDAPYVSPAAGITAANLPVVESATYPLRVDLRVPGPVDAAGGPSTLVLTGGDRSAEIFPGDDTFVAIGYRRAGQAVVAGSVPVSWNSDDAPADYPEDGYPGGFGTNLPDGSELVAVTVPSWLPDPSVLVWNPNGYVRADGSTSTWVEVPTVRAPTDDHRLLVVLRVTDTTRAAVENQPYAYTFVGSDGSVVSGLCDGPGSARCSADDLPDDLLAGIRALGGRVG